jgi:hypothetical protein
LETYCFTKSGIRIWSGSQTERSGVRRHTTMRSASSAGHLSLAIEIFLNSIIRLEGHRPIGTPSFRRQLIHSSCAPLLRLGTPTASA